VPVVLYHRKAKQKKSLVSQKESGGMKPPAPGFAKRPAGREGKPSNFF